MAKMFFTADTHFGHSSMLSDTMHCRRGDHFESLAEMHETLIANWNAVVRDDDEIWHLGDFALDIPFEEAERIFRRLRGRKHLVAGNHEKLGRRLGWLSQHDIAQVAAPTRDGKRHVVLCHYAMRTWPRMIQGSLHLFGHSHGSMPGCRQSHDVGVDVWDWRPVTLDEVMERMAQLEPAYPEVWQKVQAAKEAKAAKAQPEACCA